MGRAYSLDLRERVVALHARGDLTQQQIAAQLNLGVATVGRWTRRARREGTPAAYPPGKGPKPLIGEREWVWMEAILRARPDATMQDVAWVLEESHGLTVSRATVQKAAQSRGWTPKKRRSERRSATPNASRNSDGSSSTGRSV